MATNNNKRIEETAVTALKTVLLRCDVLEPYTSSNDKTPSWDGTVFVYSDKTRKKEYLIGRAPIQIKGTEKVIVSDTATYSCKVSDLKNYYRDGGCIFFLISIDFSTDSTTIYYSILQVFDLKKRLDEATQKKSITIKLSKLPQYDKREIVSIFKNFIIDSRKQTSFIGKDIATLEQLTRNGVSIESLSFSASGIEPTRDSIGKFLSTHEFYLYAKPRGIDIEIPIDKVSNATVVSTVFGRVTVKDIEYYPSYQVMYEKGLPIICIGQGLRMYYDPQHNRVTMELSTKGTLSDVIRDTSCYIDIIENHEITLDGIRLPLEGEATKQAALAEYKAKLQYKKDVKKALDLLGVTEELHCESLTERDEINLRNLVSAVLYNRRIGFPDALEEAIHGPFRTANLSIWIWASRQSDGYYKIENFFDQHSIYAFDGDDLTHSNPIPVSHFLLMDKDAFVHTSNMDYEIVGKSICAMQHYQFLADYTTYLCLNILRGYDEQLIKDTRLLDLAETICDWLAAYEGIANYGVIILNRMQIKKRRQLLDDEDVVELQRFTGEENPMHIRCGAYLLLDDMINAQKCFDELPSETQQEFITFPICNFGNLVIKDRQ